jgi:hypothetical protein
VQMAKSGVGKARCAVRIGSRQFGRWPDALTRRRGIAKMRNRETEPPGHTISNGVQVDWLELSPARNSISDFILQPGLRPRHAF